MMRGLCSGARSCLPCMASFPPVDAAHTHMAAPAPVPVVIDRKDRSSAMNILLHPLVIINISEHWTRAKVHGKDPNPRVIGILLGLQNG